MTSEFYSRRSVAHGLAPDIFAALPLPQRRRLVRLLARVSEASFRRGYQHGVECGPQRRIEPHTLRFERSLDRAPWPDNPRHAAPVQDELFTQYPVLRELGW